MQPKWIRVLGLLAALGAAPAPAQPAPATTPGPIQDNSFLLEEAYNQERRVVQTIQTFLRERGSGDWIYALTQEWPVPDETHQLSFTLPVLGLHGDSGLARGVGDLALNYRYQLVGRGDTAVAVTPRLSFLLPTGDRTRGLGSGGFGLQTNLAVSTVLSPTFVTHSNLGATHVFSARDAAGNEADLTSYNLGQSVIWLARPTFNVMVETLYTSTETIGATGGKETQSALVISPGFRAALDLPGDLQIVGGLAFPIGIGPSRGDRSLLLYLSVEFPLIPERKRPSG